MKNISRLSRTKTTHTNLLIGGVFIALTICVLVIVLTPAGKAALDRFDLLPRPERTTTLYFADAQAPSAYVPGSALPLTFVIENHESRAVDYHYTVMQDDHQLATDAVTISDGQQRRIALSPTAADNSVAQSKLQISIQYAPHTSAPDQLSAQRTIFSWLTKEESSP